MSSSDGLASIERRVRSSFRGGEAKRALVATMLGAALGALIALFARREGARRA